MSDWGTAVQSVAQQTHRLASRDQDEIKRSLVKATRWLRRNLRIHTQADTFTMESVAASRHALSTAVASTLGAAWKLLEIEGTLFYDQLKNAEDRWALREVPLDHLEDIAAGVVNASLPTIWAPDGDYIRAWPEPDATTHQFYGRGMFAPGAFVEKYASGTWTFYQSDGSTALVDNYADGFWTDLDEMFDLLVGRAVFECWLGPFSSSAPDLTKARQQFDLQLESYFEQTRRKRATGQIAPLNLTEYSQV